MIFTLPLLALLAPLIPSFSQAAELRQLQSDNFKQVTSQGQWLVEHYSPQCGHCRAFAPTWEKLVEAKQYLEGVAGFHMAQVNCLAQGDLCDENGIKGYPTITLFQDGQMVENYQQPRGFDELSTYIQNSATKYSKRRPLAQAGIPPPELPSASGSTEVVSISSKDELDRIKSQGGFVKFFAPWCGHCKKLAPTWKKLAEEIGPSITIAEVNCDERKALCSAEGVMGYPQLYLYAKGQKYEHNGGRTLDAMSKFAKKALEAGELEYINVDRIESITKKEEVFFIFLHTYSASRKILESVMSASKALLGEAVIYQSRDLELFSYTGAQPSSGPVLLCFKDHDSTTPIATFSFAETTDESAEQDVSAFLRLHKLPIVVKVDSHNFKEVMRSDQGSAVVLAGLRTKGRKDGELETEIEQFTRVARAWRKGGRRFEQGVIFAWMDGDKWENWLKSNYGMKRSKMPEVRVTNPPKFEYYDVTLEIEPIEFNGESIFSTLEGFHQNTLRPRTVEPLSHRLFRASAIKTEGWKTWAMENMAKFIMICVGLSIAGIWLARKLILWDFPSDHANHLKLSNRLD
ncbi:Thioredoxin/protein disulfide isomerase [Phaffia rhodozyma]|uniref:Thioredoxin/protein disulfide isomerase n=1 Tax=Phaffia rhodozyma TaxID=264483 RepID=A0A0F7SKF4_PHARH|nr:Thioredoxin/protein disulfide isomerase [Phaffia rhodozyma]